MHSEPSVDASTKLAYIFLSIPTELRASLEFLMLSAISIPTVSALDSERHVV